MKLQKSINVLTPITVIQCSIFLNLFINRGGRYHWIISPGILGFYPLYPTGYPTLAVWGINLITHTQVGKLLVPAVIKADLRLGKPDQ